MRLNVYLQKSGVGSRREAERLVEQGRVSINGVKALATQPVAEGDKIMVDGRELRPDTSPPPRLFRLHKPAGILVTNRDHQGRSTVFDLPALTKGNLPRLMSVGRLDLNSEGLLLLSTAGTLSAQLLDPEMELPRVYRVRVFGRLSEQQIEALGRGVTVDGVSYRGADVKWEEGPAEIETSGRNNWYRITLTEGKNREIRRLMEHFGCVVNRLIRLSFGPFELGKLNRGALQEVPVAEVQALMNFLALSR